MHIKLLDAATSAAAPSAATDGLAMQYGAIAARASEGFHRDDLGDCVLLVKNTAGSGTVTATVRLWGYSALSAEWHVIGVATGADADRGKLNNAIAIGEQNADKINFAQVIGGLRHFDRVSLEIVSLGGTGTAISAWLHARG